MIRLRRSGVKTPPGWKAKVDAAFHPKAAQFWKKAAAFELLGEQDANRIRGFARYAPKVLPLHPSKKKREFPAVWQKHVALKEAISAMSGGLCAYCQVPVAASDAGNVPGQVEHFKPKARFPRQAYEVRNYFLACGGCNGRKSDKWPRGGYVRSDRGTPGARFIFGEDGGVTARAGDIQARHTVGDLGLERKGLKASRQMLIQLQSRCLRIYLRSEPHLPAGLRQDLAFFLVTEFVPYSEAINQNVRRVWDEERLKHGAPVHVRSAIPRSLR